MSISLSARWLAVGTIGLACAVLIALHPPGLSAQDGEGEGDGLVFQVVPPSSSVEPEATGVVVEIRALNAENLGAFGFQLEYDASILEVAIDPETQAPLIQRADFLGSSGREVACNEPASQPGVLRLECVTLRMEPAEGASGDGVLATVTFNVIGSGTSPLTLDRAKANNPDATVIEPVGVESSQLSVESDDGINWLMWGGIIAVGALAAIAVAFVGMKARTRGGPPTTSVPPSA